MILVFFIILIVIGLFASDTVLGKVITFISSIFTAALLVIMFTYSIEARLELEEYKETYKALTYKVENCKDGFASLSRTEKEVLDEVQEWNEMVTYNQNMQDNFWFGILIPNIYDELKTIEYETITD